MTKPTKRQLQEESLEKKFGIPAIGLTLVTIVFDIVTNIYPFEQGVEGMVMKWLAGVAVVAALVNFIAYVYIKLGLLRGIFIISGIICGFVAAWAWFIASLTISF